MGSDWTDADIEEMLSISSKKQYVNVLLLLIENVGNRKYMEELTYFGQFPFIYNGITNTNPNPGHSFDEFVSSQTIAVQFQVHSLNFRTAKKPDAEFEYTF